MAYNGVVMAATLGEINVAAKASLLALNPLLAQVDFALFGSLGIGALQANLQAQLQAALKASLDIGLNIGNPFAGFQLALAGIAALQAQITLALAGGIPTISIEATGQLSAMAALAAALEIQIGGLEALIQGALAVKIPAVSFAADLQASLGAGPVFLLSFEDMALSAAGTSIGGSFSTGLNHSGNTIAPGDVCSGIILVTKNPTAWSALKTVLATGA
jgi:hypothetical protein